MKQDDYYRFPKEYFERQKQRTGFDPAVSGDWHKKFAIMIMKVFNPTRGRVLDVGCAMGALVYQLYKLGIDAYGVDISDYAIIYSPFSELKGRIFCRPSWNIDIWMDGWFRFVMSHQVLEHVPERYSEATIREMARLILPGDLIWVTLVTGNKGTNDSDWDPTHVNIQPKSFWQNIAKRVGLVDVSHMWLPTLYATTVNGMNFYETYRWDTFIWQKPVKRG